MSIQEVIDQHKKHMARVCNLYQERVTSIKTVLFLIVASVTVPTKWRAYQHKIMTTTAATDENPKQIKSTAADQREHKQDYWKQIDETHLKDNGSLCRAKRRNPTKHKQLYKTLKLANVTKKMSFKTGVRVFKQSWASTRKRSKN